MTPDVGGVRRAWSCSFDFQGDKARPNVVVRSDSVGRTVLCDGTTDQDGAARRHQPVPLEIDAPLLTVGRFGAFNHMVDIGTSRPVGGGRLCGYHQFGHRLIRAEWRQENVRLQVGADTFGAHKTEVIGDEG
jgi:hypothetical protein